MMSGTRVPPAGGAHGELPGGPATTMRLDPTAATLRLQRKLGRGGMAVVWEASEESLRRTVALKTLLPELQGAAAERKFADEARILGRLEHPNIVPVHAFGRDLAGGAHLAMKVVRGCEWADLLEPRTPEQHVRASELDLGAHLRIFQKVCEAVAFAHAQGIVHRDLKPENVMIGQFGEVLVADWGIALDLQRRPAPGEPAPRPGLTGTPAYIAPEMLECDDALIGPWTDVYLLGGILYALLTGTPPHLADTPFGAFIASSAGIIEPPAQRAPARQIPPDLAVLALQALEHDREQRPPSARALAEAVEDHFRNEAATRLLSVALDDLAQLERRIRRNAGPAAPIHAGLERCVARLVQARGLWSGSRAAATALVKARLVCVDYALAEGDPGIAESHLSQLPPETPGLAARQERAQALRLARRDAPGRRRRLLALLAGATLLAVVAVGLGLWAWQRARAADATNRRRAAAMRLVDGASWKETPDKIEMYGKALVADPTWKEAYTELAGAYQDLAYQLFSDDPAACTANLERSRAILDRVLAREPEYLTALSYRAYAHQMLGQPGPMAADLQRVVELAPGSKEALDASSLLAMVQGDWPRAEQISSQIEGNYRRALARYARGDLAGALRDAEIMSAYTPDDAAYDALAALILLARGERQVAADRLVVAVKKDPRSIMALGLLAYLAAQRGDAARAGRLAQLARSEVRLHARCYLDVEPSLRALTRAPGPLAELGRAALVELDLARVPVPPLQQQRGRQLRQAAATALAGGELSAALAAARRALAEDPSDGEARLLRGLALGRLGAREAAQLDLQLVSALAPDLTAQVQGALGELEAAEP